MKMSQINTGFTKRIATLAFALIATAAVSSCNNDTSDKAEAEMDTAGNKVEAAVNDVQQDIQEYRDENFVQDVIKSNTEELHLLALGKEKGMNKELKAHAKMMEADHKKMGDEMKAYATAKNYSMPDNINTTDNLDDKAAGADWDKEWADKMVSEHERVINKFENAESRSTEPELKAMVTKTLPTLREHLNMAKDLQTKLSK